MAIHGRNTYFETKRNTYKIMEPCACTSDGNSKHQQTLTLLHTETELQVGLPAQWKSVKYEFEICNDF
jgi:hypothetical protein